MPIYEFYSPDTNKVYQFLARSLRHQDRTPRCPDGAELRMERRVSRFAIIGKAKETGEDPFAGMDDSKVEALMADLERDMAGMDDNNPDPRQLGHLMRKMTSFMGDKVPDTLRELVGRLEAGEDPEKLEDQFGPLDGEPGADGMNEAADALWQSVKKRLSGLRDQPKRDPKLYELTDYLEPEIKAS